MVKRYVFQDEDTDGLMNEIFNTDERLGSREYKTIVGLDAHEKISLEQAHLIMHVFFVDQDADLADKIKMVAEVLLAGSDLTNDYPDLEALEAKILDVKQVFDLYTDGDVSAPHNQH